MDPLRVRDAVAQGLAFPCAMCRHYWQGRDDGEDSCNKKECGGPLSGRSFPSYDGPLPDGDWAHFCFLSGQSNDLVGVHVVGAGRRLAIAKDDQGIFDNCTRKSGAIDCIVSTPVILIGADGDTHKTDVGI